MARLLPKSMGVSALSEAWGSTIFVPKRAVLPMMQVDSALCEMNDPPFVVPDDLPSSLGDLLVRVEEVLYGNDVYRQHQTQLTFGQDPRTVEWGPNSGLQDETLWRVFEFLTGDDGMMFEGEFGTSTYRNQLRLCANNLPRTGRKTWRRRAVLACWLDGSLV